MSVTRFLDALIFRISDYQGIAQWGVYYCTFSIFDFFTDYFASSWLKNCFNPQLPKGGAHFDPRTQIMTYIFFCGLFWVLLFSVAEFLSFHDILDPYHGIESILKIFRGLLSLKIGDFLLFQKIEKWAKKAQKIFLSVFFFCSNSSKVPVCTYLSHLNSNQCKFSNKIRKNMIF